MLACTNELCRIPHQNPKLFVFHAWVPLTFMPRVCVCVCVNKLKCVLLSLCFDPDSTSDLSVDCISWMSEVSLCFSSGVCVCKRTLEMPLLSADNTEAFDLFVSLWHSLTHKSWSITYRKRQSQNASWWKNPSKIANKLKNVTLKNRYFCVICAVMLFIMSNFFHESKVNNKSHKVNKKLCKTFKINCKTKF